MSSKAHRQLTVDAMEQARQEWWVDGGGEVAGFKVNEALKET